MAKKKVHPSTVKPRFTLGGEQAESDPLLGDSFYETADYAKIVTSDDEKCFVIGRTGSGKSAMLQRIEDDFSGHVIRITPEDLSLPYVCDTTAIRTLKSEGVRLSPFFIALWKHVFLVEIIRHRYSIKSLAAKQNFLANLRERVSQDRSKSAALEYFDEFQDKFWCETDERVREITEKFVRDVKAQGGFEVPGAVKAGAEAASNATRESRSELVERYQRVVNATQLPRLNKMIAVLNEDILDSPQHFTWIVIDDLDRDWVEESLREELVQCLFNAVKDLQRVRNLKVIVALRTNLFRQLDFSSQSGGQEEKFRSLTMHLGWSRGELETMLDERVVAGANRAGLAGIDSIREVLPKRNSRRGDPLAFVLSRTLLRPRDAIAFLNRCLNASPHKAQITWDTMEAVEGAYSNDRLMALRDEWKSLYPGLDLVLGEFANCAPLLSPEQLLERLDEVSMLLANPVFSDENWLMDMLRPVWETASEGEQRLSAYKDLIIALYDIGFLGVRLHTAKGIFSHDQPDLLWQPHSFSSVTKFIVHPTFWAGLGIRDKSA